MNFKPGFNIGYDLEEKEFIYNEDIFGPEVEKRKLDDIRKSLMDQDCEGPEIVYTIAMDVGRDEDKKDLQERNLLYGACIYSKGKLGNEPVRSQGHIHAVSKSCSSSTPELYEIWHGEAIIFMQETAKDNPGRTFAVKAKAGQKVIVPPNWAHYTVNINPNENMVFGAWCVRDFGFDYEDVRAHGGLSYFPIFKNDEIEFIHNDKYETQELTIKEPREYTELKVEKNKPIYQQYIEDRDRFKFVTNPEEFKTVWENFIP